MSDGSLEVGPDEDEPAELDITIVVAWAISYSLIIAIIALAFEVDWRLGDESTDPSTSVTESFDYEALEKRIAERADPREYLRNRVEVPEKAGALRKGPYALNELICGVYVEEIRKGTLNERMLRRLRDSVETSRSNAPWHCLLDLYLNEQLENTPVLKEELKKFWTDIASFEVEDKRVFRILDRYRRMEHYPKNRDFWDWIKWCGLRPESKGAPFCRKILSKKSPEFGTDLLMMIEGILQRKGLTGDQFASIVETLGHLVKKGQFPNWRANSMFVDNYEKWFRLGALFLLCRFMNTIDVELAKAAAKQLAQVAKIQNRRFKTEVLNRWRTTCRHLFGRRTSSGEWQASVLGVVESRSDKTPQYSFDSLVERDYCSRELGSPLWMCAKDYWNGRDFEFSETLRGEYVRTGN